MLTEAWEESVCEDLVDPVNSEMIAELGLEIAQAAWLDSTYQLIQPMRMLKMTISMLESYEVKYKGPIVRRHVLNLLLGQNNSVNRINR